MTFTFLNTSLIIWSEEKSIFKIMGNFQTETILFVMDKFISNRHLDTVLFGYNTPHV